MGRLVFNYRKAMREPKKIQQLTENWSLPFAVELIPAINYFIFVGLCFGFWYGVRIIFPHAFDKSFVIVIFGIPIFLTMLVTKIKPEGKNIYLYFFDLAKYYFMIKLPEKKFCNDRKVDLSNEKQIKFRKLVEVVERSHENKNANESDIQEPVIDKNGRRLGVLSSEKQLDTYAK
ncbi:conjugal transfer protein [Bacillus atrophaeus]|uniref:conjugal transfer protein n=1 Tax=Bacillus atrophaeus TaxID=1452 RepID=UPI00227EDEF3|nr:conjugal transfer protein [Bacillus atrophaeus]MCY8486370.1 conjugal transfer protein [Bacillus atrophaeus]MCY8989802.1 conjugal transfer protein [Bacillus atrophaeus]